MSLCSPMCCLSTFETMSSMEDDARDFLKKVMKTLSAGLLWLLINMTVGIYNGWMFFQSSPTIGNYIFYVWMLASLIVMLLYFKRVWSK